jgi:CheY-like chemotaxis protein
MATHDIRHLVSEAPRVMVVDGSKLVRKLIGDVLLRDLPQTQVVACDGLASAKAALAEGPVDLVTTALVLPDGAGLEVARAVRAAGQQAYVPVIVVSGNAQEHLESRSFNEDITDYFDKSLGHSALSAFIRGYVQPEPIPGARVLYVEDSKVVALATKRMLEHSGMQVTHAISVEDALELLATQREEDGSPAFDLVLTDVYLKGEMEGGYGKRRLPVLVMTGDANAKNQSELLRAGANDLVMKPIEERPLVTKALFQLRVSRLPEQRTLDR